jgi:hypothetical protein
VLLIVRILLFTWYDEWDICVCFVCLRSVFSCFMGCLRRDWGGGGVWVVESVYERMVLFAIAYDGYLLFCYGNPASIVVPL